MINWNEVIRDTPAMLRAAVIVVLLGLFTVAVVALAVGVWKGRGFEAWGLSIKEYQDPSVQKCALLTASYPSQHAGNQAEFERLATEIAARQKMAQSEHQTALNMYVESAKLGYSAYSDAGNAAKARALLVEADIANLIANRDGVVAAARKRDNDLQSACTAK